MPQGGPAQTSGAGGAETGHSQRRGEHGGEAWGRGHEGPRRKQLEGAARGGKRTEFPLLSPASSSLSKSCTACSPESGETYEPRPVRDSSRISTAGGKQARQPGRAPRERERTGRATTSRSQALPLRGPPGPRPSEGSAGARSGPGPKGAGRQRRSEQGDTGSSGDSQAESAPPWPCLSAPRPRASGWGRPVPEPRRRLLLAGASWKE